MKTTMLRNPTIKCRAAIEWIANNGDHSLETAEQVADDMLTLLVADVFGQNCSAVASEIMHLRVLSERRRNG